MKILTKNAIYIQKNDLAYLMTTIPNVPDNIITKAIKQGEMIIDNTHRYEFIKFTKKNEIEYLNKQDWILDYNSIKNLTEKEMITLGQNIVKERNILAKKFNAMPEEKRLQSLYMEIQCGQLEFKMNSLRDYIFYKQGKIKMSIPKPEEQKDKTIKVLVKSIFHKAK